MNFLSRLFSRKGSGGTRTLFMGVVTSSSIAQEAFAKLSFSHGDREIIASKEDDDAAIMIAGSFSPEEVEEIRSKLGAHSMPEPRVAEVLAPIIAQMEATGTGGKIFVLGRRHSDAEAMKTSQEDNTNTSSNLCKNADALSLSMIVILRNNHAGSVAGYQKMSNKYQYKSGLPCQRKR